MGLPRLADAVAISASRDELIAAFSGGVLVLSTAFHGSFVAQPALELGFGEPTDGWSGALLAGEARRVRSHVAGYGSVKEPFGVVELIPCTIFGLLGGDGRDDGLRTLDE